MILHAPFASADSQVAAPEGYVDVDGIWGSRYVKVCWDTGSEKYPAEKALVQAIVLAAIEGKDGKVSDMRFLDRDGNRGAWSACQAGDLGIRVRVADLWPASQV